jgi:hypothetical protein
MTAPTVIATIPKNSREWVRVALDEYRGVNLIDVRVLVELNPETGLPVPTKKGVSLKVEKLPTLIEALRDAEVEARRLGLLPGQVAVAAE